MAHFRGNRSAFGAPGYQPRWTHADKDGIGTAYSTGGRVWFSIWHGILTETYYPTVDRPQLCDLEFLFADGPWPLLTGERGHYELAAGIGGEYFDFAATDFQPQVEFTFFWTSRSQWEGRNYRVQGQ